MSQNTCSQTEDDTQPHAGAAGTQAPPAPAFTSVDAQREGWDVFKCGVRADGRARVELQHLDCPVSGGPAFAGDADAWTHVVAQARQGSKLHQAALLMIDDVERCVIEATCGWWPSC